VLLEKLDLGANFDLFVYRERIPPALKLIGEFNLPRYKNSMPYMEYSFNGISSNERALLTSTDLTV
jgi:hypothetical protein